jgi:hypothetical protein
MKKTAAILSVATIGAMMVSSVTAFADQNIDGRLVDPTADVLVNGIIGEFDNTTIGPDPENMDEWVNVTLPTTALFYTTNDSDHVTITSPEYSITNHSAVGVTVTVSDVNSANLMDDVATLNINGISLFEAGIPNVTPTELFSIVGTSESEDEADFVRTFEFAGTSSATDTTEQNPSFNLVLNFEANRAED